MKGWYTIKASNDATGANISIYEEIGGWGITAQQFSEDLKAWVIFPISTCIFTHPAVTYSTGSLSTTS